MRLILVALALLLQCAPANAEVKVLKDVKYVESSSDPMHQLDIYTPNGKAPSPVLFWVHGGGLTGDDRGARKRHRDRCQFRLR